MAQHWHYLVHGFNRENEQTGDMFDLVSIEKLVTVAMAEAAPVLTRQQVKAARDANRPVPTAIEHWVIEETKKQVGKRFWRIQTIVEHDEAVHNDAGHPH